MTGTEALQSRDTVFEGAQPILRVGDLQTSVDYYVKVLGFKVDFHESIASVSRGRCGLFLVQGDQGNPGTWVWVGVSDVDALYEEYKGKGAKIRQPQPTSHGRARCKSRIPMATCCGWAPSRSRISRSDHGATCAVICGK